MKKTRKKILITGGAGYIGQNFTSFFLKENYEVDIIDNLSRSKPINKNIEKYINFERINLTDETKVKFFFKKKSFDLIIHLAAFSGIQEFKKNFVRSFNNNVLATRNLVKFGFKNKKTKLIFASSASIYGKVSRGKISETTPCNPVNYYGLSKLACENIICNYFKNKKINYAILRYFNVVGSILKYKIQKKTKSLFDTVGNNIKKKKYEININGKKLNTRDGTPERDFIHIEDLCKIHKATFLYLKKNNNILINCGSGRRYSVLQVIKEFEKLTKKKFKISYKITNSDETQTICSNINLLNKLLKMNIKRKKIQDYVKEYI